MTKKDADFVNRLTLTFDSASMADVARRLKIPHATVRNYYKVGRLPAPEVLIKIARETGVSLNWLLLGSGDRYIGETAPIGLGRFLEEKIGEMIDQKLAGHVRGEEPGFDVESAVKRFDDPQLIMGEWFAFEGRECPQDFGIAFFRGWENFTAVEKAEAVKDAKRVLDRSLSKITH